MTDWDVIVIGAGPAGSITARELARRGNRVLLLDKAAFPRAKVCGCCLNGAALAALDAVGLGHIPRQHGAVLLQRVKLAAGRRTAELSLPAGVSLSREVFDEALIREAVAAGAVFRPATMAKVDDHRLPDWLTVLAEGTRLTTRMVVRATGLVGTDSPGEPNSRIGAGCILIAEAVPGFFHAGCVFMATGRGGYVGLVRLEDGRLDIGAAFDADFVRTVGGLGNAAERILGTTAFPPIIGLSEMNWKGTPALTRRHREVAGHRVFTVGDAAGYVEPFTGEGMAWAIASAAALAPIAHCAITNWNDGLAREWQTTHAWIVGRRQGICRIAARVLRSPRLTGLTVRVLSGVPALARPVTALLNRPAHHPRLAP